MKGIKRFIALILIVVTSLTFVACKNGNESIEENYRSLSVVKDGVTVYTIVKPDNASDCVNFAAEELSEFIYQATGCKIEIQKESDYEYNQYARCISVGETSIWKNLGYEANEKDLNYDGFLIKFSYNTILICGGRDRGTLYGVYDFLERYVGVKFYARDYTYVPQNSSLSIMAKDITEIPAFQMRSYYSGDIYEDALFAARSRMIAYNGDEISDYGYNCRYDFIDPIHNSINLLTKDYFDEHPEFYMEMSGQRINSEICWTNGIKEDGTLDEDMELSTVKIVIEAVKKMVLDNPTARYFMIGQTDTTNNYCRCQTCSAVTAKYGGFFSANLIRFMNVVAREMKEWSKAELGGREINMATFAYTYTEQPPVFRNNDGTFSRTDDQIVCEDNLYVRIATANANLYYANDDPKQTVYLNTFNGWKSICNNFMIWDYTTCFGEYFFYIPNFRTLKQNFLLYRELGTAYVMNQADYTENESWQGKVKTYICSKLLWNPDCSVEELLDDFVMHYYGEYGDSVKEMINLFEDRISYFLLEEGITPSMVMGGTGTHMHFKYSSWPIQFLEQTESIINDAITEVENNQSLTDEEKEIMKKRLVTVLLTPERMILYNYKVYYGENGYDEYQAKFAEHMRYVDAKRMREGS